MKIKTINGATVDTDKLPDTEAEISELVNLLYEACSKYNHTMIAKVILSDNKFVGAQNKMSGEKGDESMAFLFNVINSFVMETTDNQLQIVKTNPDKFDEDNTFE